MGGYVKLLWKISPLESLRAYNIKNLVIMKSLVKER
jgi:hypothetical protein